MANNLNLVGRLTRDVELRETPSGIKVANPVLAVKRDFPNKEGIYETDFVKVTLWKNDAEFANRNGKKGDIVSINGRLESSVLENQDGSKNTSLNVIANKFEVVQKNKNKDYER